MTILSDKTPGVNPATSPKTIFIQKMHGTYPPCEPIEVPIVGECHSHFYVRMPGKSGNGELLCISRQYQSSGFIRSIQGCFRVVPQEGGAE